MDYFDLIIFIVFCILAIICLFGMSSLPIYCAFEKYKEAKHLKKVEKYILQKLEYEYEIYVQKININKTNIERYIAYVFYGSAYCNYPTIFKSLNEVNKNATKIKKYFKEQFGE